MSNNGTSDTEMSLNTPKTEDELAEQILNAVSECNSEEMDRLFSVELEAQPDADLDEEEDSNDSDSNKEEEDSTSEDSSQAETEDASESSTTQQEMSPAEQRLAKLEQELANAKAAVGRTASLQSRLAQLERQLKTTEANKKKAEVDDADSKLRERINKLKEIDPDTAELFEALAERHKPAVTETPEASDELDPALHEEYYKVLAVHSDADKIFQHPYWHMWKKQLTPAQRAWAESSDSGQVIEALNAFKQYLSAYPNGQQQAPTQGTEQRAQEETVDATKEAREKKLQRSAESSDKPVKKGKQFDAESFFNDSYAEIAKEAGIHY